MQSRNISIETESSQALADIALNTLGLVMIVMLIYIMLFRETITRAANAVQSQTNNIALIDSLEMENGSLKEAMSVNEMENRQLAQNMTQLTEMYEAESESRKQLETRYQQIESVERGLSKEVKEYESKLGDINARMVSTLQECERLKKGSEVREVEIERLTQLLEESQTKHSLSGLWRFRTSVTELVDHNSDSEKVDWTIDYFLYLDVSGGKVSGKMFGVREIESNNQGDSQSFAEISGTLDQDGHLKANLQYFAGSEKGSIEKLNCRLVDDHFVGRLEHVYTFENYRAYVGPTRGEKITDSIFE